MLSVQRPAEPVSFDLPVVTGGVANSRILNVRDIQSSVTATDLKAHLLLLTVFHKVHDAVQQGGVAVDGVTGLPITTPAEFLSMARAQHRFDLWVSMVLKRPERDMSLPLQFNEIPPVDVLMLLHAYMLSPWNFYEDCKRVYPELETLGPFPLTQIKSLIDTETMRIIPTAEQIGLWETCTGTKFAMPLSTDPSETVKLKCPSCNKVLTVPWINLNQNTGFGQSGFSVSCTGCDLSITRETLCVGRFLQDLSADNSMLAHTLLTSTGHVDPAMAMNFTRTIQHALNYPGPHDGANFGWKMSEISDILQGKMGLKENRKRILHILKAYEHENQATLDLGDAVLRQSRFIYEMHRIGWCGDSSFEGEETSLPNAVVRYHHFLALNPYSMVASLDIDLAFHTHQLQGSAFRETSFKILGRLLNHDDSFEKGVIIDDLNFTMKVWKETYGSTYVPTVPNLTAGKAGEDPNECANKCSGSMVGTIPGSYEPAEDHFLFE